MEVEEEEEDNIYCQWSLEDDKALYEGYYKQGKKAEQLATELKRGYQGVVRRLENLNDPSKSAYKRYFKTIEESRYFLEPVQRVIERILWDPMLDISMFSFVYKDRFAGLVEALCNSPNGSVKGKERILIKAIPPSRIETIRYRERVVWDKKSKVDLVFGSSLIGEEKEKAKENEEEKDEDEYGEGRSAVTRIEDVVGTYEEWWLAEQEKSLSAARLATPRVFLSFEGEIAIAIISAIAITITSAITSAITFAIIAIISAVYFAITTSVPLSGS
jgi:uncharacterized protein (UPF0248 family)